jgi:hypothetical protein
MTSWNVDYEFPSSDTGLQAVMARPHKWKGKVTKNEDASEAQSRDDASGRQRLVLCDLHFLCGNGRGEKITKVSRRKIRVRHFILVTSTVL